MKVFTDSGFPPVVKNGSRAALRPVSWSMVAGTNLRRDDDEPRLWRPAGKPHRLAQEPALPIFCFIPADGDGRQVTFWLAGLVLSYTVTAGGVDIYSAPRRRLGALPARPLDFVAGGNGVVKVIVADAAPVYMAYGSDLVFSLAGEMPEVPEVGIGVADVQMMRTQVRGGKLSGTSSGRSPGLLSAADNRLLVERASEAYSALRAQAAALGRFVQPVLARWRILDADGATLMRGPWVYPSAELGLQCTGGISLASGDSLASVSDGVLLAQTYRLRLIGSLPALEGPWRSIAAKLVLEVTEEVDPVGFSGAVNPGYVDVDTLGSVSARVYLPGCSPEGAAHRGLYRSAMVEALRRAARQCRVVGVVEWPFGGGTVPAALSSHTVDAGVVPEGDVCSHAYSAALRVGSALFLGNPRRLGSPAVPPGCYAIGSDCYSPLVTVYDTAASAVAAGGVSLALTAMKEAGVAYSLAADLMPLSAPPEVPAAAAAEPEAGTLHFIDTSAPGTPPVASVLGAGEIRALAQPPRAGSAWDFARVKLLVFGAAGIRLATFGASGELRASAPFDPRGVDAASCVCAGLNPAGASCLYVLAGGDLLRILPSRTDTLLRRCDARAIAWSGRYGELWLLYDDRMERMNSRGERVRVLADELSDRASAVFASFAGEALVSTSDGLFSLDREDAPEIMRCRMILRADAPGMARRAELEVAGSDVTGSVTLLGDNGSEVPEMLAAFGLRGQVNAPVVAPLRCPFRRRLTLDADLRLPPDATLAWE